jgi:hypothetical protein
MDRLSSCYFCGGALDASLSEHPIVPSELRSADDKGSTVVLCSTCRRKLGAVVEEVVAAARDGSAAETATTARSAEAETPSTNGTSLFDDEPTTEADEWKSPAARDAATESTTEASTASDDEPATEPSAASDDTADDEPTLTKLEYSKVMRLLENRPFPVDRGEIREVATSAYDISPDEFDAVIDAAVKRDLIAVENGQFVDPA